MPNIRSAKKRMRSDARKHTRNQNTVSELKTLGKKLSTLNQDLAKAEALSAELVSKLDKAVSRGIIPRGRADRKKSRIASFLARIKAPQKKA